MAWMLKKIGNIYFFIHSSIFLSSTSSLITAMLLYVVMLQEAPKRVKLQSAMNFTNLALFPWRLAQR